MLSINYDKSYLFKDLQENEIFIFKFEMDWLNFLIEEEIKPSKQDGLRYIRAYKKMGTNNYVGTNGLISDFRKNPGGKLKDENGYCHPNQEVYILYRK